MNRVLFLKKIYYYTLFLLLGQLLLAEDGHGQLCTNNKDTIYGLTTTGQIVAINVLNGLGNTIGSPTGTAVNSNAIGFSSTTGLFYFFNKNGAAPQQFVSYNPISSALTVLPASPIAATHTVRSGCVNNLGSGYYTIDTVNIPVVHSKLLYYNITLNSWSTLTSALVDPSNNPIPAIDTLISGDMAIDGSNNLWLLCSSKWNYALYEIKAPLPVVPVGTVTVTPVIPVTPIPGAAFGKVSFTGVAFNSAGTLFLTLGNNASGNKLYKLTSTSAASLTLVGPIAADYGADLTSCAFPAIVLPVTWIKYSVYLQNNSVILDWTTSEDPFVSEYIVEHSTDKIHWEMSTRIAKNPTGNPEDQSYYYKDDSFSNGLNYYRIIQTERTGKQNISETRYVLAAKSKQIIVGPNPVAGTLYFFNMDNSIKYYYQLFDIEGKLLYSAVINAGQPSIDVSHLENGTYFVRLYGGNSGNSIFKFTKW
jgi:hypothetical protein